MEPATAQPRVTEHLPVPATGAACTQPSACHGPCRAGPRQAVGFVKPSYVSRKVPSLQTGSTSRELSEPRHLTLRQQRGSETGGWV